MSNGTDFCCNVAGHLHRVACIGAILHMGFDGKRYRFRLLHGDLPEELVIEISRPHGDGGISGGQCFEIQHCQRFFSFKFCLDTGQIADAKGCYAVYLQRSINAERRSRSGFFQLQYLCIVVDGHAGAVGAEVLICFNQHLNRPACLYGG